MKPTAEQRAELRAALVRGRDHDSGQLMLADEGIDYVLALLEENEALQATQARRLADLLDAKGYAVSGNLDGVRAVICRMSPGPCWCGVHVTEVQEP